MNKTKLLLCLSAITLLGTPISKIYAAPIAAEVDENQSVARIDIHIENLPPGATFDPKSVLSKLKTRVGDPFSQLVFDSDLKTLAEEYDRIEPIIEVVNGEIYITLKVWIRPIIRSIHWQGNRHLKTKTLQKELGIKPHAVFNRVSFNKAFNKVKEFYIKKGYFESQLQYTVISDPKTQEVDIEITVKEGRSGKIDNIVFKGFTKEEESELLAMIHTKKYNLFTSWFTGMGTYHEEAIEQDRLTIFNFLQDKGYADARIDIRVLESKSDGKILIEVDADRGELYHFGTVTFDGNILFTDEEIERLFAARPEEIYSPEKLRQTVETIKEMYGRKGYIDTSVQYDTLLQADQPVYNVHFQIEEGQQYKIGLIRVIGNVQTQTHVILRESLLVPGDTFDSAKLKATQARLENIGYFKSVNVYAVRTQDDVSLGDNYRDVYIEVTETTTGNVSLFLGFSSADSIFGGLDLTESNFNYRGLTRIFKKGLSCVRGGGEYLHARATFGVKQKSYAVSWLTPYFMDTPWRFGFEFNATHSSLPAKDYDIDTYSFSVYASYPLSPFWTFGTRYRVRNADIEVSRDAPKKEREQNDVHGILSGVSASITFDNTDSAIKPRNGLRAVGELEFVGLGGNFTFFRLAYLNSYYTKLWKYGIMKYRADFRWILPVWKSPHPMDIPLSERFFLGGVGSVRGYKDFDLGPHYEEEDRKGDPKGGISSGLVSIEYNQEIFRFLDAFIFADAGSVSLKYVNPGTFRMSYGFGVRLDVMNRVPLTFGLGFPVNPEDKNQVRRFFFQMGGQF